MSTSPPGWPAWDAEREKLEARIAELEAIVRQVQWHLLGLTVRACPMCLGWERKGHEPSCPIALAGIE